MLWPDDPRVLAARHDGLFDEICKGLPGTRHGSLVVTVNGISRVVNGLLHISEDGKQLRFQADDGAVAVDDPSLDDWLPDTPTAT